MVAFWHRGLKARHSQTEDVVVDPQSRVQENDRVRGNFIDCFFKNIFIYLCCIFSFYSFFFLEKLMTDKIVLKTWCSLLYVWVV